MYLGAALAAWLPAQGLEAELREESSRAAG